MTEHIENNNNHLTQEEKLNLKNLAVSVKAYDAVGDGNADDTSAFTEALEENHRVYVPEGTYKITGELTISENCELELAQDALLEFVPSNKRVIVDEETGNKTTVDIEAEEFKCITLSSSSRLIGNHATIRVPYTFEGSVVCIAANPEDDTSCIAPRYLKDINIVKPIEQYEDDPISEDLVGQHASLDNETNGTALLIEGIEPDETENPSILWGVEALGIRIAGSFDYGIRCINTNYEETGKTAWKYETSIDALIENCRTGIYMDHYNNARISAVIQMRQAYRHNLEEEESLNYADHGIHLVNSTYIDFRNSRIITRDPESDDLAVSNEFKCVELTDDCRGLMIDSSLCSGMDNSNVRDYIHTNTLGNFDNMTVLGKPNADFFNYDKDSVENYLLHNFKIKYSGNTGALEKETDITSTCFIPCTKNSTIIVKDFVFINDGNANRIAFYNEFGESLNLLVSYGGFSNYFDYKRYGNEEDNEYRITFKPEKLPDFANIRMCCNTKNIGSCPTVYYGKKDGEIYVKDYTKSPICLKDGYLKDGIYIDPQYVIDLNEAIDELSAKIAELEELA